MRLPKKPIFIALASAAITLAYSGFASAEEHGFGPGSACSLASLKGDYGVKLAGTVQVPNLPERKLNTIAKVTFNGAGAFNANFVGRINGDPLTPSTITAGTYTVAGDCTGAIELTQIFRGFTNVQASFVIVEQGRELYLVVNSPAPPANPAIIQIGGEAQRVGGERR